MQASITYNKAAILNQSRESDSPLWFTFSVCVGVFSWWSISWEASNLSALGILSLGEPPVTLTCWLPPILQSGCQVLLFISVSSLIWDAKVLQLILKILIKPFSEWWMQQYSSSMTSETPYCPVNFHFIETSPFGSLSSYSVHEIFCFNTLVGQVGERGHSI